MYLENIPSAAMYEKSFMHRDVITQAVVTRLVILKILIYNADTQHICAIVNKCLSQCSFTVYRCLL